jgi:cyclin B
MRSMLRREHEFMPEANYMQTQPQINAKMRSILNDWLYEVHRKYKLRHETLFLAICVIDSYLSKACISRRRFQLVGVTALLIAAKVEEIEPPQLADLVYVTDNSYSKQDILDMEMAMLGTLGFRVAAPTAAHFLLHLQAVSRTPLAATRTERGSMPASGSSPGTHRNEEAAAAAVPPSEREKDLAWYIMELSLLDVRIVRHRPSHVAASALLLSGRLVGQRPAWPASVAGLCGLAERELEACCGELRQLLDAAPRSSLQAIRSRYRHLQSLLPTAGIPQTVATPSTGAEGCEKSRS